MTCGDVEILSCCSSHEIQDKFLVVKLSNNDQCCIFPGAGHLDQTVSVFVWVSGREHYVGLFDINQWYQAQMPNTIHWKRSGAHTG